MSDDRFLGVKLVVRLLWACASVAMITYGWVVHDLRFMILGCAFAVGNNLSGAINRLERNLGWIVAEIRERLALWGNTVG